MPDAAVALYFQGFSSIRYLVRVQHTGPDALVPAEGEQVAGQAGRPVGGEEEEAVDAAAAVRILERSQFKSGREVVGQQFGDVGIVGVLDRVQLSGARLQVFVAIPANARICFLLFQSGNSEQYGTPL